MNKPIHVAMEAAMDTVAPVLNEAMGEDMGFLLITFNMRGEPGKPIHVHYLSNVEQSEVVELLREQLPRMEEAIKEPPPTVN